MDLEQGTQIVEVCDSTSLQTDPIMGLPIPESVLGRQMDAEERGTQIVEVCDSTSLQTYRIMGFPIPVSVLGRQMDAETILYLTSGKGITECLQGHSISQGCHA